ncbi:MULTISPECIES: hypothetical protein [Rhizobium/Agrobacterium group]|uniref:hypothetical protein n=1 Tax=Rhizobium/Agrobacterium group TaxID=227290 RepID=UPI000629F152|nr:MULTISPECIES: hypothetical protein [Rhizobium/Agrobacterium group]KRA63540.1 hypothetical protein ASD85_09000 [Rhizobium sp. Root651]QCL88998.1 hypothetical protein CFBP6623_07520 [Agrobacterium tumefaciens]TKT58460.1 hypothetical protein YA62_017685 [Agrobacterium sp. LC34]
MKNLVGPLLYLRVWHPTKLLIDFIMPLAAATAIFLLRFFYYPSTGLLSSDGLLSLLVPLLGALAGFYIAALTAVSAFPIASLDREMPGDRIKILGKNTTNNPTRRQFLSLQFGYLAFTSILLFTVSLFSTYLKKPISIIKEFTVTEIKIGNIFPWISLYIILFILFNLISVTFFSLYYLSDRIHRFEPELEGGPDSKESPKVRAP